jgi:carbon starvation protein
VSSAADLGRLIANDYLDAAVAAFFLIAVIIVIADSARIWLGVLRTGVTGRSTEVPFDATAVAVGD